jgi:hypothetical protein
MLRNAHFSRQKIYLDVLQSKVLSGSSTLDGIHGTLAGDRFEDKQDGIYHFHEIEVKMVAENIVSRFIMSIQHLIIYTQQ